MKIIGAVAAAFVVSTVLIVAQRGVAGSWQGRTPGGDPVGLELAVKAADLTGTMTVGGQKAALEKGRVSKDRFTFTVTMGGGTEAFTGEAMGDEVNLWMDDRGRASAITLTRVTPARK
jgi:hypothetical protein